MPTVSAIDIMPGARVKDSLLKYIYSRELMRHFHFFHRFCHISFCLLRLPNLHRRESSSNCSPAGESVTTAATFETTETAEAADATETVEAISVSGVATVGSVDWGMDRGVEVVETVAEVMKTVVDGLGRLLLLDGLGLFLLTLGKSNNAAGDALTLTLTVTTLTVLGHWVLSLVVVILTFVENHGASDNGVGSAQVDEEVSVLVLSVGVPTSLDLLNITDTTIVDVLVRVAALGIEWVEDLAGALAAVLKITELVNLECVKAGLDALELTDDGGKIMRLLFELESSLGVGVTEEIELAGGNDSLIGLGGRLPVEVDWGVVVSLHITGADGGSASPFEAVATVTVASVALAWEFTVTTV